MPASAPEDLAPEILAQAAGLEDTAVDIGFGAYIWNEEVVRGTIAALRQLGFGGRIIVGGPQISYAGPGLEYIYPEANIFIRGYAEHALAVIAGDVGEPTTQGVHHAGQADSCGHAQLALQAAPSPWTTGLLSPGQRGFVRWETQRGCPFRCSFCQHRDPGVRPCRQVFPDARVEEEIDLFCRAGVREIAVLDPIFNAHPRAAQILDRFRRRGYSGRLSLQCRAESVRPEFLDAAARLDVCLEIGLQTIHEQESEAIQRRNHLGKVERILGQLRCRGIDHEVSVIYGLPGQTLESFKETVAWCIERRVPVIKAFPLLLLRGTALDVQRKRWGFVVAPGPLPVVVASSTFSQQEWHTMARVAEALRLTEGKHPARLAELVRISAGIESIAHQPRIGATRRAA